MLNSFAKPLAQSLLALSLLTTALQAVSIKSGPMIGHTTMKEVSIWVQTDMRAEVAITYREMQEGSRWMKTKPVFTEKENAYAVTLVADGLKWSTEYEYAVVVDGYKRPIQYREAFMPDKTVPLTFSTKPRWRHVGDGKTPPDFSVAIGSCAYVNEEGYLWEDTEEPKYGGQYQVFESIYQQSPDLMVWLGDNIYLTEADWQDQKSIYHRYSFSRSIPELRPLLASAVHYAIWDDHDYGPNNPGREFWNKKATLNAFKKFWANPPYVNEGTTSFFNWGDVNFYLLDNRWFRTQSNIYTEPRDFLGKDQVDWLIEAMKHNQSQASFVHRSTFHIVACGGQVINDSWNLENYRRYKTEWQYLMDRIKQERIGGIVFISGDVHYTELSEEKMVGEDGRQYTMKDITVSPLTSGAHSKPGKNSKRIGGPFNVRNFATLNFSGPITDRVLTVKVFDSDGKLLNQKPEAEEGSVLDEWVIHYNDLKVVKP